MGLRPRHPTTARAPQPPRYAGRAGTESAFCVCAVQPFLYRSPADSLPQLRNALPPTPAGGRTPWQLVRPHCAQPAAWGCPAAGLPPRGQGAAGSCQPAVALRLALLLAGFLACSCACKPGVPFSSWQTAHALALQLPQQLFLLRPRRCTTSQTSPCRMRTSWPGRHLTGPAGRRRRAAAWGGGCSTTRMAR